MRSASGPITQPKWRHDLPFANPSQSVANNLAIPPELLAAGIRLFEYRGGLLHAKTLTIDRKIVMIGSANLDRRSFDLNYENNIVNQSEALTAAVRARQETYIATSREVTASEVEGWSAGQRLWNNAVAMFGPIL
jgi:cardiolipin synthase